MSEKFDDLKKKMLEQNEELYGDEIRSNYGEEVFEESNNILSSLSEDDWKVAELLRQKAEALLRKLAPDGDPDSPEAHQMAELHGAWACSFWPEREYYPEMHLALAAMYTEDKRFVDYYEAIVPGGSQFIRKAIESYCKAFT